MTSPLDVVRSWPVQAGAGWTTSVASDAAGVTGAIRPWASVTKVLTSVAIWIAVEEGIVGWDDPAGPRGSTLAHLLSHASGVSPDSDDILSPPASRRIYSNRGIELAASHVSARAGMPFSEYVTSGVIEPLGMSSTVVEGSPAWGAVGPLGDLLALARELLQPRLLSTDTLHEATQVAFPGLAGILPGFGRQDPNDWGLGVEIRGAKRPHWTGHLNSPETFGHFGQSGSFLWVDPSRALALCSLADQPFGPWAAELWPPLADAVLSAELRG